MDALPEDTLEFLRSIDLVTTNQFLAANTADVAEKFEEWLQDKSEVKEKSPPSKQTLQKIVYSWKQDVTKKMRGGSSTTRRKMVALPINGTRRKAKSPSTKKKFAKHSPEIMSYSYSDLQTGVPEPEEGDENAIITKPTDNDVLSGRGGRTNLHTGNEWFRRLVKCSRGFYRHCPKHTKLQVAKAIVAAVKRKNPPGRFLISHDRDKDLWKEISYKTSVDKASQALRERYTMSAEDEDIKRKMVIAFNNRLKPDPQGQVTQKVVQNAVEFAVTKVALESAGLDTDSTPTNGNVYRKPKPSSSSPVNKTAMKAKRKVDAKKLNQVEERAAQIQAEAFRRGGFSVNLFPHGSSYYDTNLALAAAMSPSGFGSFHTGYTQPPTTISPADSGVIGDGYTAQPEHSNDTFGAPAPPELVSVASKTLYGTSPSERRTANDATNGSTPQSVQKTKKRRISLPSSAKRAEPSGLDTLIEASKVVTSPDKKTKKIVKKVKSSGVGTKRKSVEILDVYSEKENDTDTAKKAKGPSMSPFHREILEMNLSRMYE